jgi:tRNA (mo5U34)-methyltransferase
MNEPFTHLAEQWPENEWLGAVCREAAQRLRRPGHGDMPRWARALQSLPAASHRARLDRAAPGLGAPVADPAALRQSLMQLHPWRKGPLELGGVRIDSEWRSDWKWQRLAPHVGLRGRRVLDIGCGNGYFGWRMLGAGAALVVGIDPTLLYVMQWQACRHFAGDLRNYVLPLGVEDLPPGPAGFDTVLSMGVLYHRRDPLRHLEALRALLGPSGGTLVLETLVLPADAGDAVLRPDRRYARMSNVWSIPGTERLRRWVREAGFPRADVVDITPTRPAEQRRTAWMRFESLEHALDPQEPGRTVEGYPAPLRALLIAAC